MHTKRFLLLMVAVLFLFINAFLLIQFKSINESNFLQKYIIVTDRNQSSDITIENGISYVSSKLFGNASFDVNDVASIFDISYRKSATKSTSTSTTEIESDNDYFRLTSIRPDTMGTICDDSVQQENDMKSVIMITTIGSFMRDQRQLLREHMESVRARNNDQRIYNVFVLIDEPEDEYEMIRENEIFNDMVKIKSSFPRRTKIERRAAGIYWQMTSCPGVDYVFNLDWHDAQLDILEDVTRFIQTNIYTQKHERCDLDDSEEAANMNCNGRLVIVDKTSLNAFFNYLIKHFPNFTNSH